MYLKTINHIDEKQLFKMIEHAAGKYRLIETDYHTVDKLINNLINSAYMNDSNIIKNINMVIDIYYDYRSRYNYQLSDDRLMDIIIQAYYDNYGIADKSIRYLIDEALS